jgi:hypothetical protein
MRLTLRRGHADMGVRVVVAHRSSFRSKNTKLGTYKLESQLLRACSAGHRRREERVLCLINPQEQRRGGARDKDTSN